MPTHITQIDDPERGMATLRVEGQVMRDDALLLLRIARDLHAATGNEIDIDLADVDFIDSEAAAVLKELQSSDGFKITGIEILLQNVVNEVERHGA